MEPKISVVLPAYNAQATIKKTLDSLKQQTFQDYELIVIDDCSKDKTYEIAKNYTKNILRNKKNLGPAASRNFGIKKANSQIIAFIDADCIATKDWLKNIYKYFTKGEQVIMGNIKIPKSTYVGDCISALGFPGGGSIGFEKIWKVKNGYTDHITSCNFAAKKYIFEKYGYFDETFPLPGGEDPELSYRWVKQGIKIRYAPDVIVYHKPRTKLIEFIKWQIARGRTNYHFKKKVGKVNSFIKLRLWSSLNVLKASIFTSRILLVPALLCLSFFLQQYGYFIEFIKEKFT